MRLFSTSETPETCESRTATEKRKKGRVKTGVILTELGEVVDLSESGVRVKRRGATDQAVGSTLMLGMRGPGQTITCPCRVVWVKKSGWFHTMIGLEFLDQSETFARELRKLSVACIAMRDREVAAEEAARNAA
jgi:hypothetical protein